MSVVKKWGAAICTGFYFVRSNPNTINIFRRTHFMIATKRQRMPKWQARAQPMMSTAHYGGRRTPKFVPPPN